MPNFRFIVTFCKSKVIFKWKNVTLMIKLAKKGVVMEDILKSVKDASRIIANLNGEIKRKVLNEMADKIYSYKDEIIKANEKDLEYAKNANLNSALSPYW